MAGEQHEVVQRVIYSFCQYSSYALEITVVCVNTVYKCDTTYVFMETSHSQTLLAKAVIKAHPIMSFSLTVQSTRITFCITWNNASALRSECTYVNHTISITTFIVLKHHELTVF
jgi:hypothetical protein